METESSNQLYAHSSNKTRTATTRGMEDRRTKGSGKDNRGKGQWHQDSKMERKTEPLSQKWIAKTTNALQLVWFQTIPSIVIALIANCEGALRNTTLPTLTLPIPSSEHSASVCDRSRHKNQHVRRPFLVQFLLVIQGTFSKRMR